MVRFMVCSVTDCLHHSGLKKSPVGVNLPFATSVYLGFCSALADHRWPQRGVRADSQKWVTYKGLAVRTLDARHVKMNHAMQHMAPTVLLVGLLLLAQSDALCRWPAMAPDDKLRHSGFLKLQSKHVEQRCLSGTSPQWQFMLSVELCSLMGLFHRNGLSSFFLWQ